MRAAIFLALLSLFPAGCVDIVGADIQQVVREQKHFSTTGKPEVVLSTFDGSIDVERITGKVDLRSGDGSIRARELSGEVNASTGDGSMTLEGKFGALRVHSGDGSVRIHAAPGSTAASDWDISTGDGSITLEIPDGFGAELDAHTGDGRIHVNEIPLSNVTGEIRRNTVRGRLGSGGSAVRLRTGDGSITLRRS